MNWLQNPLSKSVPMDLETASALGDLDSMTECLRRTKWKVRKKKKKAVWDALAHAVRAEREDAVALLLSAGFKSSSVAVLQAVRANNLHLTRRLYIDTYLGVRFAFGKSLLHHSARMGCREVTQFLLEKGFDVNIVDGLDVTPLMEAAELDRLDVVDLLFDYGARLTVSKARLTPLSLALISSPTVATKILMHIWDHLNLTTLLEQLDLENCEEILRGNNMNLQTLLGCQLDDFTSMGLKLGASVKLCRAVQLLSSASEILDFPTCDIA